MYPNSFDYLVSYVTANSNPTITKTEYEIFCKEYIFDKLKGIGFGKAFCKRFNVSNIFLTHMKDRAAKKHIDEMKYVCTPHK